MANAWTCYAEVILVYVSIYYFQHVTLQVTAARNADWNYTNNCPPSNERWVQRGMEYNCDMTKGMEYHCLRTDNNKFTEICRVPFFVQGSDGCPVFKTNGGVIEAVPVEQCNNRYYNKMCPKASDKYSTSNLIKYPGCLSWISVSDPDTTRKTSQSEAQSTLPDSLTGSTTANKQNGTTTAGYCVLCEHDSDINILERSTMLYPLVGVAVVIVLLLFSMFVLLYIGCRRNL